MAPKAAKAGASKAPTAPAARGNSAIVSSFSFLIIILRAFPSWIISFTFSMIFSPDTVKDSLFRCSDITIILLKRLVLL
jgi:hypothetical protein